MHCVVTSFSCVLAEGMPQMDNQQKTMMWTNNYMDSGIQSGATTNVSYIFTRLSHDSDDAVC